MPQKSIGLDISAILEVGVKKLPKKTVHTIEMVMTIQKTCL
jgi:hypothetical protein